MYQYLSDFVNGFIPLSITFLADVSLCTHPNMAANSLILIMTKWKISNRWKAINGFLTQLPFEEVCHSCPVKSPETVMIQSNKIQYRLQ